MRSIEAATTLFLAKQGSALQTRQEESLGETILGNSAICWLRNEPVNAAKAQGEPQVQIEMTLRQPHETIQN